LDGEELGYEPGRVPVGVPGEGSGDVERAQADGSDRSGCGEAGGCLVGGEFASAIGAAGCYGLGCAVWLSYTAQVEARTTRLAGPLVSASRVVRVFRGWCVSSRVDRSVIRVSLVSPARWHTPSTPVIALARALDLRRPPVSRWTSGGTTSAAERVSLVTSCPCATKSVATK